MKDIYQRLKTLGFDAPFIRSRFLPKWWEDSEAHVPATRALAEFAISRFLGIAIAELRDPEAKLALPALGQARLKLRSDMTREKVAPGLALADRAARLVVDLLTEESERSRLPDFAGFLSAQEVRAEILATGNLVTLRSLLDFAWSRGIVVIHLADVPEGSRTLDGMASFVGKVPVVVLASRKKSPPWIAFHLAHELGHIFLGHASAEAGPVVDAGLDAQSGDPVEEAADAFAMEALTGSLTPLVTADPLNGDKLARWAKSAGALRKIDAGTLSLVYGRVRNRLPVAQRALAQLGLSDGAQGMAAEAMAQRFPEGLPADLGRLLAPERSTN